MHACGEKPAYGYSPQLGLYISLCGPDFELLELRLRARPSDALCCQNQNQFIVGSLFLRPWTEQNSRAYAFSLSLAA